MQYMKSLPLPKKYQKILSLAVAILTILLAVWSSQKPEPTRVESQGDLLEATSSSRVSYALVTEVVDGDTIKLDTGQTVRYIGIDTPETKHPTKPVGCFGKEASLKNKDLVLGRKVKLVKDVSEADRYGRLLRYVYFGDVFINDVLVREGYAFSTAFPPDIAQQEVFKAAQEEAKSENRGLWNKTVCP